MTDMRYMDNLDVVVADAVGLIREKTGTYGDSWKRRDGPGAWFTTVRPIDRLEGIMKKFGGDIFAAIDADPMGRDGSALACVRDIMNYMILIEAHSRATLGVGPHGPAREVSDPPECTECRGPYDVMAAVTHTCVPDKFFCSIECAKRFAGELQPSPASGSHHALGEDARLDAMERAGEVTQDTQRAGGTRVATTPRERLETFWGDVRRSAAFNRIQITFHETNRVTGKQTLEVSPPVA